LLAGLVYAPTADDPVSSPAGALSREQHVMGRLVSTGALTQAQADSYLRIPVGALLRARGARGC
jgi:membrane peptidoglycan carboxypeptidase